MTTVRLQFHATTAELLEWALEWAGENALFVAEEHYFPEYAVGPMTAALRPGAGRRVDGIALRATPFEFGAATTLDFAAANPETLWISVPRDDPNGLQEVHLGGSTGDPEVLRLWHRLVRRTRARMHRGARLRSGMTGQVHPAPARLHSPGAHDLARAGVRMLSSGGVHEYLFDDLDPPGVPQVRSSPSGSRR